MRVHVLGCHGPWPCANGATSGYLMEHEGKYILVDCGSGVLGKLMAICDPAKLEGILLSHLHFDHASDLMVLRYYLEKMGKTLKIYIPGEDHSPLRDLLCAPAFEVIPYSGRIFMAGLEIAVYPVRHPVPCRAMRFEDGEKIFVYTGDTNDCPGLADFAKDADAILADAAFLQAEWNEKLPHMSAVGAAQLAKDAGAKKLYLTHLPVSHAPETLEKEAKEIFADASSVKPGLVIAL